MYQATESGVLGEANTGLPTLAHWTPPLFLDTSSHDLAAAFFIPALKRSVGYDRGVGYFSSGWLRLAAEGMEAFAARGGRARWVTSPILDEADWLALRNGDAARTNAVLKSALQSAVDNLRVALTQNTRAALAWMVADGIITFRLAVGREKLGGGDFHDKFGVFTDVYGNQLAFNGSYNDSVQGTRNYESLKLFPSWTNEAQWRAYGLPDVARFARLWNNEDPNARVYDLPEAVRDAIIALRGGDDRPYLAPPDGSSSLLFSQSGFDGPQRVREAPAPALLPATASSLALPVALRPYQEQAIENWFAQDGRGVLEMATGAGKTITALAASARLRDREGGLLLVIAVPYQHLADQWADETARFGYRPLVAYGARATWENRARERVAAWVMGDIKTLCIVTTHETLTGDPFVRAVWKGVKPDSPALFIADEAHHLGAPKRRAQLPASARFRLALSATPERYFDAEGTRALRAYFGPTAFTFGLSEAIGVCLTPYDYHPVLVELKSDENAEYRALSAKIGSVFAAQKARGGGGGATRSENGADEMLKSLLMKRARLVNNAENKQTYGSKRSFNRANRSAHAHAVLLRVRRRSNRERYAPFGTEAGVARSHVHRRRRRPDPPRASCRVRGGQARRPGCDALFGRGR